MRKYTFIQYLILGFFRVFMIIRSQLLYNPLPEYKMVLLLPIPKSTLQSMKYDGGAMDRIRRIKKFIPIIYELVISSASQSKSSYTYADRDFFTDIFTPHDPKMHDDLTRILQYVFPGCSVYYSEKKDIGGGSISKSITVDWS